MSFTAFTGSWSDNYIRKQGTQVIYTQSIDWKTFYAELDRVLREMAEEHFDAIAAIAQGGVIPAAILQAGMGHSFEHHPDHLQGQREQTPIR